MTTQAINSAFDPRRGNVHPIFDPSRFENGIDYYGAIYDSALLATRLMNSPQGLQHDYCFFYGKNTPANAPAKHMFSNFSDNPSRYACDKAIGELDQTDVRYVEQQRNRLAERVRFRLNDLGPRGMGVCRACNPAEGVRGTNSIIDISRSNVYDQILAPGQSRSDTICAKFLLTLTLLHEVAHAANNHLFGPGAFEAFCENSLVSEAGFECEARFFGQRPDFNLQATNPNDRMIWGIWQSQGGLPNDYSRDRLVRNAWQMPKDPQDWTFGLDFVARLFDDDFWEGETSEYAERGAFALIPDRIAYVCASGVHTNMAKSIPLSIKDLFKTEGPSYAKKKYSRFANPERKLRELVQYDRCGLAIL